MTTRRAFIKTMPLTGCAIALEGGATAIPSLANSSGQSAQLQLEPEPVGALTPLKSLRVKSAWQGRVYVRDGNHQVYFEGQLEGEADFVVAGALGTHSVTLVGKDGMVLAMRTFHVDCSTVVEDEGGRIGGLLKDLYWTMATDGPVGAMRYKGEVFTYWASWLMDNTQTLKGMKYFWPEVKSNVNFYADSQREDGMVWENFEPRTPVETYWEHEFKYGDFARSAEDGWLLLRRAPVENHVEPFLLEALYFSWKASGDTPWMASRLDAAIRAVKYATSNPYRWSEKYNLLKRGFTIDTWDFLCESEAKLSGDIMVVDLAKTHFGIFFGDNANMIVGLRRLSTMLEAAARGSEAPAFRAMADEIEKRLNALSLYPLDSGGPGVQIGYGGGSRKAGFTLECLQSQPRNSPRPMRRHLAHVSAHPQGDAGDLAGGVLRNLPTVERVLRGECEMGVHERRRHVMHSRRTCVGRIQSWF